MKEQEIHDEDEKPVEHAHGYHFLASMRPEGGYLKSFPQERHEAEIRLLRPVLPPTIEDP